MNPRRVPSWLGPAAVAAIALALPALDVSASAGPSARGEQRVSAVDRAEVLVRAVAEAAIRWCEGGGAKWIGGDAGWRGLAAVDAGAHGQEFELEAVTGRDVRATGGAWSQQLMALPGVCSLPPPMM